MTILPASPLWPIRRALRDLFTGARVTIPLADIAAARKPSRARPLMRQRSGRWSTPYRVPCGK
jgi:hypothetical protein